MKIEIVFLDDLLTSYNAIKVKDISPNKENCQKAVFYTINKGVGC